MKVYIYIYQTTHWDCFFEEGIGERMLKSQAVKDWQHGCAEDQVDEGVAWRRSETCVALSDDGNTVLDTYATQFAIWGHCQREHARQQCTGRVPSTNSAEDPFHVHKLIYVNTCYWFSSDPGLMSSDQWGQQWNEGTRNHRITCRGLGFSMVTRLPFRSHVTCTFRNMYSTLYLCVYIWDICKYIYTFFESKEPPPEPAGPSVPGKDAAVGP